MDNKDWVKELAVGDEAIDQADVWIDAWLTAGREAKQAQRAALPPLSAIDAQARKVRQANAEAKAQAVADVVSNARRSSL